ncbi:MAG: lysophospholipase [Lachnospiraceae bacterium]|nr:lysophospholipase [Lachnospiraceae bacterium]
MSETEINLLGEDDFLQAMNGENKTWRKSHVINSTFTTADGIRLNYYKADNPKAGAVIVMVHGFCEFWGKYHEYAWYLWQTGYTVYFLEQRCHGYSEGRLPEPDVVHIDSFETYVKDLHGFTEQIVQREYPNLPLLLLAHSMGGAIAALYIEDYPDTFAGALLSSPMLKMNTGNITPLKILFVRLYMILARKQKSLCPGQHHFDPKPDFENSSALSEARFNYLFNQRLDDPHYRTSGASLGWVMAAIDANKSIIKNAGKIRIPVVLMQAGLDSLVEPEGFDAFMARVPHAKKYVYENSRHEIFNAKDEARRKYYRDVMDQLEQMLTGVT